MITLCNGHPGPYFRNGKVAVYGTAGGAQLTLDRALGCDTMLVMFEPWVGAAVGVLSTSAWLWTWSRAWLNQANRRQRDGSR